MKNKLVLSFILLLFAVYLIASTIYYNEDSIDNRIISSSMYMEGMMTTILPESTVVLSTFIDSSYIYLNGSITYIKGADVKINTYYVSPSYDTYRYTEEGDSIFLPANTTIAQFVKNGYIPKDKRVDLTTYGIMNVMNDSNYQINTYLTNLSTTDTAYVYINFIWRK